MNILISAYACKPTMGSEPAVGWSWIIELGKYHNLWVLTSQSNRKDIESYVCKDMKKFKNIHFVYVEINAKLSFWHKEFERLERLYYYLWQRKAYRVAKSLTKDVVFDIVHHITYVTCVLPTFMYKLNIPFIYGPVSGGENIPSIIKIPMNNKEKLIEKIRIASQRISSFSINTIKTYERASLILVATEETKQLVPKRFHDKTIIMQAIGMDETFLEPAPNYKPHEECKILMAGRMLYWKGFELGIKAFIELLNDYKNIDLTILGHGKEYKNKLMELCGEHLGHKIHFIEKVEFSKMKEFYEEFDIFVNCSLRDSGCLVVMEAMSRGLPVICISTGGPRVSVTEETGIKINPAKYSVLIDELTESIKYLIDNPELRLDKGKYAYIRAKEELSMERKVYLMNSYYKNVKKQQNNV